MAKRSRRHPSNPFWNCYQTRYGTSTTTPLSVNSSIIHCRLNQETAHQLHMSLKRPLHRGLRKNDRKGQEQGDLRSVLLSTRRIRLRRDAERYIKHTTYTRLLCYIYCNRYQTEKLQRRQAQNQIFHVCLQLDSTILSSSLTMVPMILHRSFVGWHISLRSS